MKPDRCGATETNSKPGCETAKAIQNTQPFPKNGSIAKNLGILLPVLKSKISDATARAYSYVLSSVKLDHEFTSFKQFGSAPNFQGGVLTLCTCKHQMRATRSADDWKGVWLAGFTSRTIFDGKHWLFYLAKIDSAQESHAELWQTMNAHARNAKVADRHFLGDVFRPKLPLPTGSARFTPSRYVTPSAHAHRQHRGDRGWRNDINYRHSGRYSHPPLLVADPSMTFIWNEPMIFYANDHCRNFYKWSSLSELLSNLRVAR